MTGTASSPPPLAQPLAPRDAAIARLLAAGLTPAEIAVSIVAELIARRRSP